MATRTSRISGLFMTTFREKRDSHPVYDLVTTSAYLPTDSMALTLNGTTKWASAQELQRGRDPDGSDSFTRPADTRTHRSCNRGTSKDLQAYIKAHAEFTEIGDRMLQQW
jgi:serine/threonine-protein kinase HipA